MSTGAVPLSSPSIFNLSSGSHCLHIQESKSIPGLSPVEWYVPRASPIIESYKIQGTKLHFARMLSSVQHHVRNCGIIWFKDNSRPPRISIWRKISAMKLHVTNHKRIAPTGLRPNYTQEGRAPRSVFTLHKDYS